MTVIAMTREMGTLGKDIAAALAARLKASVIHHELVDIRAPRETAEGQSQVTRHLRAVGEGNGHWQTLDGGGYLTELEVLELAERGNVIIRGWGAPRLLRGVQHILCVRVCAPMDRRIAEMSRRLNVSDAAARSEIQTSDRAHASVFTRLFETDWRDPVNYDLVLNTERIDTETGADILLGAACSEAFAETRETRRTLEDKLLAARIRRDMHAAVGHRARDVHVAVSDGHVRLYGLVRNSQTLREIETLVAAPLDRPVRNEIAGFSD